jgi:hypothetical protein
MAQEVQMGLPKPVVEPPEVAKVLPPVVEAEDVAEVFPTVPKPVSPPGPMAVPLVEALNPEMPPLRSAGRGPTLGTRPITADSLTGRVAQD